MPKNKSHTEVIARGLLIHRGRVLLCRNLDGNYYYLPGGHVEFGEPAARALEREFVEESGRIVRAGTCVLVSEHSFRQGKKARHEVNLVFHVEHVAPESTERRRGSSVRVKKRGRSSGRGKSVDELDLPRFRSQEPDIEFEWVDLAATVELDIRPAMMRAWLSSGGRVEQPNRAATLPPLAWYSDIAPDLT